eukprot:GFYU01001971.1.p1 GENE.GFYU01001971.1~~GFYU01001971.1.p1  ORF type:complete len:528 (+),score=163.97 GFYU01001971.1:227-1810(+)
MKGMFKSVKNKLSGGNPSGGKKDEEDPKAKLLEHVPLFRDSPAGERQQVFQKKLKICCIICDFTDLTVDLKEKEAKTIHLQDLVEYITNSKNVLTDVVFPDIMELVTTNLLRSLPPNSHQEKDGFDPEEDEPVLDPSWPHLQLVYELFLRFVVSSELDAKKAKQYIDQPFVLKLLELFDSEDPRERDYLKTILHRIYGKFMNIRAFVRKSINNIFYRFIYETERHNGIAELLEILGSIINGFAVPLKPEHKVFLKRALLPLHKVKTVSMYHQQLTYCVTQFIDKDPKLAEEILLSILKFWPAVNSPKEVMFMNEVEEILELTQPAEFQKVMGPLFKRISRSINSYHFQIAERALFLWNNEYILSLIAQNRQVLLPIVFGALYQNSKNHWSSSVHGLTYNVLKLFMDMDSALFNECSHNYNNDLKHMREREQDRISRWEKVENLAQQHLNDTSVIPETVDREVLRHSIRMGPPGGSVTQPFPEEEEDNFNIEGSLKSLGQQGSDFKQEKEEGVRRKSVLPVSLLGGNK